MNDAQEIEESVVNYSISNDPGIKVLIVDDEVQIIQEMSDYLLHHGFSCETATNAEDVFLKINSDPLIAIILTDVRMPGMNGIDMLKKIKSQLPPDRELETIVITGHAGRDEAIEALQIGALDFLIKPISLKHLGHVTGRAVSLINAKRAEKYYNHALETALDEQRKLNKMQQEFVSLVSHEFRTPMAIIDGSAQRLLSLCDKITPVELSDRAQKIRNAISRMTGLIDSTLTASQFGANKIKFKPERFDLFNLVNDVISETTEVFPDHDIRLTIFDVLNEITGDPSLLRQVLTNLITNAAKYSPEAPRIDIEARRGKHSTNISVHDRGIGIPKDEIPCMFSQFFRASTSKGFPGTGLGLHLSKQFVVMHGGTVEVESQPGKGSVFTIRLPLEKPDSTTTTVNTYNNDALDHLTTQTG